MNLREIHARLREFHQEENAQDLIEYALIATVISLSALAGMSTLASSINTSYRHISERLP